MSKNVNVIRHALVLLAVGLGIAGMGTIFSGVMHGNGRIVAQGVSLLLVGLWWAGRELGRSIAMSRARTTRTTQGR